MMIKIRRKEKNEMWTEAERERKWGYFHIRNRATVIAIFSSLAQKYQTMVKKEFSTYLVPTN